MIGALTNHLWQSTLFAVLVGLLTLGFRRNWAQVRYWLWFSASVKFFAPFALLIVFGTRLGGMPVSQIAPPEISIAIEQIAQPFAHIQTSTAFTRAARSDWSYLIVGVWLAGFVAIVWTRLQTWRRIRAMVRSSSPFAFSDVEIPAGLQVRSYSGLLEPGVVGWRRPVLLLPSDIMERLTRRQLSAVLAHELCHFRRRDNLTSAIHMIVEAIFWFHPLVWWIGARLLDERERACDEDVLRLGNEPHVYSEGILNICDAYRVYPLRCVSGVTGSDLKKRIHSILAGRVAVRLSFAKKTVLAAAALLAVTAPVVLGMTIHPDPMQDPAQPPSVEVAIAARNAINRGVRAFRAALYGEAIDNFKQALELDPSFTTAELYLATAYAQQYTPAAASEENKKYAELAIQSFSKILQKEPENVPAIAGLAAIYQKDNQMLKARELYFQNVRLDPQNAVPLFGVGSVDLAIVADRQSGLSAAEKFRLVEEGLEYARRAVELKPDYYQAMSTLSLLYRQKAELVNTDYEKSRLEEEASSWLAKSNDVRGSQNPNSGSTQ